jgi:hypothetical protein
VGRRFVPGVSGNPKGGPKRPEPQAADVEWLYCQTTETIEKKGKDEGGLSWGRALLLGLARRALTGDAKATETLMRERARAEATRAAQAATKAKQAAEKRERKKAEAAARPVERPQPIVYAGYGPMPALKALEIIRELPSGHWQIPRRTFDILTAARPELLAAMGHEVESSLEDCLEGAEDLFPGACTGPPGWYDEVNGVQRE